MKITKVPTPYRRDSSVMKCLDRKEEITRKCEELTDAGYQFMCLRDDDGCQIALDGPRFVVFRSFATDDDAVSHAHDVIFNNVSHE